MIIDLRNGIGRFDLMPCLMVTLSLAGIGWAIHIVVSLLCISYNMLITWVIYYLCMSFTTGDLPWKTCNNTWNTDSCLSLSRDNNSQSLVTNASLLDDDDDIYVNNYRMLNKTGNTTKKWTTPAEEFWKWVKFHVIVRYIIMEIMS